MRLLNSVEVQKRMVKGLENVFKTGIEFGAQIALSGNLQGAKDIGVSSVLSLGDKISE